MKTINLICLSILLFFPMISRASGDADRIKLEAVVLGRDEAFQCLLTQPDDLPLQESRSISKPYLVIRIMNPNNRHAWGVVRCVIPNIYRPVDVRIHSLPSNSTEWDWYLISLGSVAINHTNDPVKIECKWKEIKLK